MVPRHNHNEFSQTMPVKLMMLTSHAKFSKQDQRPAKEGSKREQ